MSKPTSIRILNLILLVLLAVNLIVAPSVVAQANKAGTAVPYGFLFLGLLALVAAIFFVRKRKLFPAIIAAFAVLMTSLGQMQMLLSMVVILMFFLRNTRAYFRSDYKEPAKSASVSAVQTETENLATTEEKPAEAASEAATSSQPNASLSLEKPQTKPRQDPDVSIREATAEDTGTVHSLMMAAFEEYRTAIPPSSALNETEEAIGQALLEQNEFAAILYEDETPTAMVRFKYDGDAIVFFRLSVVPNRRRRGYARKLVQWIERQGVTKGLNVSRCKVRQNVRNNLALYQDMGYEIVDSELAVRSDGTIKIYALEKKLGV